ncbi:hypothetical protein GC175_24550 [bacterium]|nr:hypothetical protein [bacterium]
MFRSTHSPTIQRRLFLLVCLLAAAGLSIFLTFTADARPVLPQETSPLSPLPQIDTSPVVPPPSNDLAPIPSQVTPEVIDPAPHPLQGEPTPQPIEEELAVETAPTELATPVTSPGMVEPVRAQLSLVLVGMILVGLVGVVVSIIAQARRS